MHKVSHEEPVTLEDHTAVVAPTDNFQQEKEIEAKPAQTTATNPMNVMTWEKCGAKFDKMALFIAHNVAHRRDGN